MNAKYYKKAIAGSLLLMQMTTFSLPALGASGLQNFSLRQTKAAPCFEDVREGQWYKDVVKSCYEMGLMVGKSEKQFDPQGQVTLAEAIAFAVRLHSTYNGNEVPAPSEQGKWYDGAVAYAIEHQIIDAGEYADYERSANRAEVASIIAKALPDDQWKEVREIKALPDVTEQTPNFKEIMKLYKAGVLTGNDELGTFNCSTRINRAEVAAILNRVVITDNRCTIPLKALEGMEKLGCKLVKWPVPANPAPAEQTPTDPTTPTPSTPAPVEPNTPAPTEPTTPTPTEPAPAVPNPAEPNPAEPTPTKPAETPGNPDSSLAAFAAEVVRLVNVEREKAGLKPVQSLSNVEGAAYIRAKELEIQFSHTRPNGTSTFTVLDALNENFRTMGENIAMGQRTPAEVMEDWMNSSGHRKNILNANFTGMGVGVYKTANGTLCWVQLFVG